jgi:hypothetical protein
MAELLDEVVFDPMAIATHENPYPDYARLRADAPAYHNVEHDFWALSRHDDVLAAEDDWQTYTGMYGVDLDDTSNQFGDGYPPLGFFLGYDPPRHTVIRKALQPRFLPKGLRELAPMIQRHCDELIASFVEHGRAEIVEAFAAPLPDRVFSEVLGLPEDRRPELSRLLRTALMRDLVNLPAPFIPEEALQAGADLKQALVAVVAERREQPARDDLIGRLLAVEIDGDPLPNEEIVGSVFFVFTAATEEVSGVITNALLLLSQHPEQRALLVADPTKIAGAVEEVLRYETIVQHLVKTTTRPVELHGTTIPEGARVVLLYGSANRDGRKFPDPDRFDVERAPRDIASFGGGIHRCLGAPLARLEARIALESLLPRIPDYQIAGEYVWSQRLNFRGMRRLPLSWSVA